MLVEIGPARREDVPPG